MAVLSGRRVAAGAGRWSAGRILVVCWLVCVLAYLGALALPRARGDGMLFHSDGLGYFAVLRSAVFDRDLDLRNDLYLMTGVREERFATPYYTVGMAVVWLPFYLLAHAVALLGEAAGLPVRADGYHPVYQVAVCLGSMVYGLVGLRLVLALCREWVAERVALAATLLVLFGWNLVYYLTVEPSMSHMASLAVVGGLVARWRFGRDRGALRYWGGLGLLTGLAAAIRPQDGAFGLLPGLSLLGLAVAAVRAPAAERWPRLAAVMRDGAAVGLGVLAGYAPQMVASAVAFGSPLSVGYTAAGQTLSPLAPRIVEVLFSTWHGLFAWHPVLLLAPPGLVLLARRDRAYAARLGFAWLVQVWIVGSWEAWWGGDAFGARMLISCAPIIALGLALALGALDRRFGPRALAAVLLPAILWNALFLVQYRGGLISMSDPITLQQLTVDKLTAVPDALAKLRRAR